MLQELFNRNEDLRKLYNEGYEVEVMGGYLIVHHIPYLNSSHELNYGKLVAQLNLSGTIINTPYDHTAYFSGKHPCNSDGTPIRGFVNSSNQQNLGDGIIVNHFLSNLPVSGRETSYYEKIKRYEAIISRPAEYLYPEAIAKTYRAIENKRGDSPFKYIDSWVSKYDIQEINNKLSNHKVAIVGVGGTGSYILDFVSKTPVKEIHLFDGDSFYTHNAFRAPGAASLDDLNAGVKKVDYFENIYSKMRNQIFKHSDYINSDNIHELLFGIDFVFICIDNNEARELIIDYLVKSNIPFIDTGIGLNVVDGKISGIVRCSYCSIGGFDLIKQYISNADANDAYKTNIQIAELNALNAIFAVIKWKQIFGFYADSINISNVFYSINDVSLVKA